MASLSLSDIAVLLGASLASTVRWQRGDVHPSRDTERKIDDLLDQATNGTIPTMRHASLSHVFASRGVRTKPEPLFDHDIKISLGSASALSSVRPGVKGFWGSNQAILSELLSDHEHAAKTLPVASLGGMSAGKNTYTYDAHTYHTKVPPQGIAEVMSRYLPNGGLVLDPFAGSGMTGVAARVLGLDVILNELSPAASFIADRFTSSLSPAIYSSAVEAVIQELQPLRARLYQTTCRECGQFTEILYTVWSYRVTCYDCGHEFVLWDHCRRYGNTVREHKILSAFPCPACAALLKKSRLARSYAVPVLLGYKCCSRTQIEHPLTESDLALINDIDDSVPLADGFYPETVLPDGVNLSQPKRHGFLEVKDFYTTRNLTALSHLWKTIHRVNDRTAAAFLAFAFTSLYQRVTRLSEYRFWGGSGNTANYNVPYIFNEANVFVTFARKAKSIRDHLATTATRYRGRALVRTGSATNISFLPDDSIDFIFTDPPFGANINYSEMNLLWESWLGAFTDCVEEAIVNRTQGKGVTEYGDLMRQSLRECYRVLRPGHWMVLVFMNSNASVWEALKSAIVDSGFVLESAEIFDKQHATFKQLVSENTAGSDLLLHCRKAGSSSSARNTPMADSVARSIPVYLDQREGQIPTLPYLHVKRSTEVDYRTLYSEWLSQVLLSSTPPIGFADFRRIASDHISKRGMSR
ncbi:hypothetical protein KJ682_01450 [bacterium]|nr:hypothetical protein [bacterium]